MAYRSTKRGRGVRAKKLPGYGFHWFGRDDSGVHIWGGQVGALKWGSRILGTLGATFIGGSLVSIALGAPIEAYATFAGVGSVHFLLAVIMHMQKRRIEQLGTAGQVSKDLGLEPDHVDQLIEEKGIRPRMIINGEAYFDPTDLGEAATLLRGAPAPAPEALLRPAAGSLEESTTLLKASEGEIDHQSRQPDIPEVDMLGLKDA